MKYEESATAKVKIVPLYTRAARYVHISSFPFVFEEVNLNRNVERCLMA